MAAVLTWRRVAILMCICIQSLCIETLSGKALLDKNRVVANFKLNLEFQSKKKILLLGVVSRKTFQTNFDLFQTSIKLKS